MHTFLVVTLVTLITPLTVALIAVAVRPRQADDLLKRVVGDAPTGIPRGPAKPEWTGPFR